MSDTPRLSLKTLRAFVLAVEEGTIAGAAQRLNIAASAVAAALDQVEAEFGATLLIRTRASGIAPTPQAQDMADRFRAVLEHYDDTIDAGRALTQSLTGTLRIGYYAPVAPAFLPGVLGPMMQANPGLALDLHEHDNDSAQEALLAGRLDVILFAGRDLRRGITTHHLLDLPPYVLVPDHHELTHAKAVSIKDVARYPIIQLDRPLARPYVDDLFRLEGLRPHIAARADSTEMVRSLVGAGAGVSILAMRPLISQSYGGDHLHCLPLTGPLPTLQLMAGHAAKQPRRIVMTFLQMLEEAMTPEKAAALTVLQ